MASTNAPIWVSWEARSADLNAAMEPVMPSRMRLSRRRPIYEHYNAGPFFPMGAAGLHRKRNEGSPPLVVVVEDAPLLVVASEAKQSLPECPRRLPSQAAHPSRYDEPKRSWSSSAPFFCDAVSTMLGDRPPRQLLRLEPHLSRLSLRGRGEELDRNADQITIQRIASIESRKIQIGGLARRLEIAAGAIRIDQRGI